MNIKVNYDVDCDVVSVTNTPNLYYNEKFSQTVVSPLFVV